MFAGSLPDFSVSFSERFLTQPVVDCSRLVVSQDPVSNRCKIDVLDDKANPSPEAIPQVTQKVASLFKEIQEKGCATFVKDNLAPSTKYKIRPEMVAGNLNALKDLFKQPSSESSDPILMESGKRKMDVASAPAKRLCGQEYDSLIRNLATEIEQFSSEQPLKYQDFLDLIPPDIEIVVGQGEAQKTFKVHKSLLCYDARWSAAFKHNMSETQTNRLNLPEVQPDYFEKALDWIYTGTMTWDWLAATTVKREIIEKIYEMEQIARIADFLGWKELFQLCSLRMDDLTDLLKASNKRDSEKKSFDTIPISSACLDFPDAPRLFANPAEPDQFYDVSFVCKDKTQIRGNSLVLASRSPFFRGLLADHVTSLPISLPPAFFIDWMNAIHKGEMTGENDTSHDLFKYITADNIWDALKIAQTEHLTGLAHLCSEKIFIALTRKPSPRFSPDQVRLIQSVTFGKDTEPGAIISQIPVLNKIKVQSDFQIPPKDFEILLKHYGEHLRIQDLNGCSWVNAEHIALIAKYCPLLQKLVLNGCTQVTGQAVELLATNCKDLQYLGLNGCTQVTGQSVELLATNCTKLQHLAFFNCSQATGQAVELLATNCRKLQYLALYDCTLVTGQAVEMLATNCRKLQYLALTGCTQVTGQSVELLAINCRKLQHLYLSGCTQVTGQAVELLATNCRELQHLLLSGSTQVTGQAVELLATNCRNLQYLILNDCTQITGQTIELLAINCSELQHLALNGCIQVTAPAVELLAINCRELQHLVLSGCTQVTGQAVELLATNCRELQHLHLNGCTQITGRAVELLATYCRELRVLSLSGMHPSHGTSRRIAGC